MWKKLSDLIHRVSNGWVALSTLIIFLLFTTLVLPGQASKAEEATGNGNSPDMSYYYTADDLMQMAELYGEEGRQAYVRTRFTFDLIWPIVYAVFLSTGISWMNHKVFAAGTLWQRANIVPVLGMLFDYLENVSTSVVMMRYPSPTVVVDMLAGGFTLVKWIFVNGSFVLLFLGLVVGLVRWVRAKSG